MLLIKEADIQDMKNEILQEMKKMQENIKPKRFMKSREVRSLLGGISPAKLQSLRVGGHMPAINADGMWLYEYEEIIRFLERNKVNGKEAGGE